MPKFLLFTFVFSIKKKIQNLCKNKKKIILLFFLFLGLFFLLIFLLIEKVRSLSRIRIINLKVSLNFYY
jgi:predicted transporter